MSGTESVFTGERLADALEQIGARPAPELFEKIRTMYTEPVRFYHTDQHVTECLKALDQHTSLAARPAEVEVAIWFHDAIYDSRKPDNEEQSAALAARTLSSLAVAAGPVARIEAMILATKSHLAEDQDTALLLDIDLGILGQPADVFARYDDAIRKEYSWVPDEQYRTGRASVLQSFLDRSRIYVTDEFRQIYEQQARRNLASQLKRLGAPT